MPQFLTTSGTSHLIEDIIIKAKSELVLITPYLKLSRILFERLTEANHRGVRIRLVYGKSELHANERRQLDALTNIELLFLGNLHAKCYFNESTLIVSSMNLYEFSEKNNREMGIVLTRRDDEECFADALAEAHSIIAAARGGVPQIHLPAVVKEPVAPVLKVQPEYDQAVMVQQVFEMLKQKSTFSKRFSIETTPHPSTKDKMSAVVTAQDFPRRGINFKFGGDLRFDFTNGEDYRAVKEAHQAQVNNLLGDYRCFWNRDVLQIYAAKNYARTDEQTVAKHFMEAIEKATGILKSSPLIARFFGTNR